MIAVLLVVLGIAAIASGVWWYVQSRDPAPHLDPEAPLPLFSSRATDGVQPPAQHHVSAAEPPAEVAMLRRNRTAAAVEPVTPKAVRAVGSPPAPPLESPAIAPAVPPAASDGRANGATPADPRAPTAPHAAIPADAPAPVELPAPVGHAPVGHAPEFVADRGPGAGDAPLTVGTVQFLPGRLEVLQGRGIVEQEVRFVRPPRGGKAPEVTFGRGEGPPFTHVQLRAPTVSRLHARMVQQNNGAWALENLSTTNPVVVNGEEVPRGAPPRPLADGDRLEMGEVVFRYHAR